MKYKWYLISNKYIQSTYTFILDYNNQPHPTTLPHPVDRALRRNILVLVGRWPSKPQVVYVCQMRSTSASGRILQVRSRKKIVAIGSTRSINDALEHDQLNTSKQINHNSLNVLNLHSASALCPWTRATMPQARISADLRWDFQCIIYSILLFIQNTFAYVWKYGPFHAISPRLHWAVMWCTRFVPQFPWFFCMHQTKCSTYSTQACVASLVSKQKSAAIHPIWNWPTHTACSKLRTWPRLRALLMRPAGDKLFSTLLRWGRGVLPLNLRTESFWILLGCNMVSHLMRI